jgi:hypothetical protein
MRLNPNLKVNVMAASSTPTVKTFTVDATKDEPVKSGLHFKPGSLITIVASGRGVWNSGIGDRYGPSGVVGPSNPGNCFAPNCPLGCVVVIRGATYDSIEGGLAQWDPNSTDELQFVYNDVPGGYGDNFGTFEVRVLYDSTDIQT